MTRNTKTVVCALGTMLALLGCGFTVGLAWYCEPPPEGAQWETGIVGSTNLHDWYVLARLPYGVSNCVALSNRPAMEFYRAFNTVKQ